MSLRAWLVVVVVVGWTDGSVVPLARQGEVGVDVGVSVWEDELVDGSVGEGSAIVVERALGRGVEDVVLEGDVLGGSVSVAKQGEAKGKASFIYLSLPLMPVHGRHDE